MRIAFRVLTDMIIDEFMVAHLLARSRSGNEAISLQFASHRRSALRVCARVLCFIRTNRNRQNARKWSVWSRAHTDSNGKLNRYIIYFQRSGCRHGAYFFILLPEASSAPSTPELKEIVRSKASTVASVTAYNRFAARRWCVWERKSMRPQCPLFRARYDLHCARKINKTIK